MVTGEMGGSNGSGRGAKMLFATSNPLTVGGAAKRDAMLVFASGVVSQRRANKTGRLPGKSFADFGRFEKPIKSEKGAGVGDGFDFALSNSLRYINGCLFSSFFISTS
jgi:hypothetical protein